MGSSVAMPLLLIVALLFMATLGGGGGGVESVATDDNDDDDDQPINNDISTPPPQSYNYGGQVPLGARECLATFVNGGECIAVVYRVFLGGAVETAPVCCKMMMEISQNCRLLMFPNPNIFPIFRSYCAARSGGTGSDTGPGAGDGDGAGDGAGAGAGAAGPPAPAPVGL